MYEINVKIKLLKAKGRPVPEHKDIENALTMSIIPHVTQAFDSIFETNKLTIQTITTLRWVK